MLPDNLNFEAEILKTKIDRDSNEPKYVKKIYILNGKNVAKRECI